MFRIVKKLLRKASIVVVAGAIFGGIALGRAEAKNDSEPVAYDQKYFTNVIVKDGESLWSIANEYMDEAHYSSIYEYVDELKQVNGLTSDKIYEGQSLIVIYYEGGKK